jgi:hypothetical protein
MTSVLLATALLMGISHVSRAQSWESRSGGPLTTGVARIDVNRDGRQDLLITTGDGWHLVGPDVLHINRVSGMQFSGIALGDFDGDGTTDLLVTAGSEWRISRKCAGPFERLRGSDLQVATLAFGDFDGDGRTDVLRTTGEEWQVSSGGSGAWQRHRGSNLRLAGLAFGDFDGDGRTDAFRVTDRGWELSSQASRPWTVINALQHQLPLLRFADVDGDRKTDVVLPGLNRFSSGGSSALRALPREFARGNQFGDYDGDTRPDSFPRPFTGADVLQEVQRLSAGQTITAGWTNEIKSGGGRRIVAFGSNNKLTGWRIVDRSGRTLIEFIQPQEVPFAEKNPTAEKIQTCARELERCRVAAQLKPLPPSCFFGGPVGLLACVLDQIFTGPSFDDLIRTCLLEFERCLSA